MTGQPVPTERLIKRMRRFARKWQQLAPRQADGTVSISAVHVRAVVNLLWQAAGRLEDTTAEHVRDVLRATVRGFEAGERHATKGDDEQ